jgi:ferredoxin, 2Fe-2S
MSDSTKTLTIVETLFQDAARIEFDVKTSSLVTILDVLNAKEISINQSCGGNGSCGTCRIVVSDLKSFICEKSDYERQMSVELNLKNDERLACQCEIKFESEILNSEIKIVNEFVC